MSLQVWLPLNGTLENKGLSNVNIINNNAIVNTAGKIGNCYEFITFGSGMTLPASTMTSFVSSCSVAFWIKIISWNSSYATFFQAGLNSTPWAHYRFGILRYASTSKLCFTITNSSGSSSSSGYLTSDLEVGIWYHLAFTYETGKIKCYRNGVLDKEYTTSIVPDFAGITNISIGRSTNGSSYQTNCDLNDFRIYNHCLSAMEVKQLSQGLILHYKLDNNGLGNENLAIKTGERAPDNSSQVEWRGFKLGNLPITTNETLTVSFDLKMVIGTAVNGYPYLLVYNTNYKGPHGQWIYVSNNSTNKMIPSGNYAVGDIIKRRVSVTITTPSSFTAGSQTEDWIEFYSNYSTENEITITNIKVERGNKATPWCPNKEDDLGVLLGLNDTVEYDCSGYQYNGTRFGSLVFQSDTPRYLASTYFDGSSYIVTDYYSNLGTGDFTISAWVKIESSSKTYQPIIINKGTGAASVGCGIYFNHSQNKFLWSTADGSSATEIWSANTFTDIYDKWTHVVMVRDSNDSKKGYFYINGTRQELASIPAIRNVSNTTYPMVIGAIGPHNYASYQWTGNISDVRIYTTALSADDIIALYENSAYIASDGTKYTYEFIEE